MLLVPNSIVLVGLVHCSIDAQSFLQSRQPKYKDVNKRRLKKDEIKSIFVIHVQEENTQKLLFEKRTNIQTTVPRFAIISKLMLCM